MRGYPNVGTMPKRGQNFMITLFLTHDGTLKNQMVKLYKDIVPIPVGPLCNGPFSSFGLFSKIPKKTATFWKDTHKL